MCIFTDQIWRELHPVKLCSRWTDWEIELHLILPRLPRYHFLGRLERELDSFFLKYACNALWKSRKTFPKISGDILNVEERNMQIKNSQPLVVTYWNRSQKKCTTLILHLKFPFRSQGLGGSCASNFMRSFVNKCCRLGCSACSVMVFIRYFQFQACQMESKKKT